MIASTRDAGGVKNAVEVDAVVDVLELVAYDLAGEVVGDAATLIDLTRLYRHRPAVPDDDVEDVRVGVEAQLQVDQAE